jgi:hypothetical protein
LWEDFYIGSLIAGAMTPTPMPSNPFDIPRGFGAPTWRKGTPGVPIATPDMVTGQDSLTATELVAQQDWSYSMDEDAVIALMPAMTAELRRSGSEIIDDFVLNADSTAAIGNINSGPSGALQIGRWVTNNGPIAKYGLILLYGEDSNGDLPDAAPIRAAILSHFGITP